MEKCRAGQLTKDNTEQRDRVETAMFVLARALTDLDECILRTQQALKRSSHVASVLGPGLERLQYVRDQVLIARRELSDYWSCRQVQRWKVQSQVGSQAPDKGS